MFSSGLAGLQLLQAALHGFSEGFRQVIPHVANAALGGQHNPAPIGFQRCSHQRHVVGGGTVRIDPCMALGHVEEGEPMSTALASSSVISFTLAGAPEAWGIPMQPSPTGETTRSLPKVPRVYRKFPFSCVSCRRSASHRRQSLYLLF